MKKSILLIFAITLFGCTSNPYLTSQAIEVSNENVNQYWVLIPEPINFPSPKNAANRPAGHVKVRYLIDSNGEVYNPEVIESVPMGVWDDLGIKAVKKIKYEPTESNLSRKPVYSTARFDFDLSV